MSIIAKAPTGGDFVRILAPDGIQFAVCCDVVDRGEHVDQKWHRVSHKVSIHWMLADTIPSGTWVHPHDGTKVPVPGALAGKQYMVSRRYTLSLHEKSALRQDLEIWRGRAFTDEELEGFDLENLIGVQCALTIQHNLNNGNWYANVRGIARPVKGAMPVEIPGDYVRFKDREQGSDDEPSDSAGGSMIDDDLPF